jgi:hypothetical protein
MAMLAPPSRKTQQQRQQIMERAETRLIEADEFCRMLTSNRRLVRFDQPEAMLRGLYDLEQGLRFIVEEEKLSNVRAVR